MSILEMSKKDFAAVPYMDLLENWKTLAPNGHLEFSSFVIIPVENEDGTIDLHDSGYGCMEFCLVDGGNNPICRVGGGTDVVNIDGIGGYGADRLSKGHVPRLIPVHGWSIDLLPCGYFRMFTKRVLFLRDGFVGSNFEVFSEDMPRC